MKRKIQLYVTLFMVVAILTYKFLGTKQQVGKGGEPETKREGVYQGQ
jgi:hypothetical protein